MNDLLQPKEVTVTTQSGEQKTYILSKFPAISGREIVTQYPLSALPKLGDYQTNESIMLKIMSFVAVKVGETTIRLTTKQLVENHVPDWETLGRLEIGMMEYNCSFFKNGLISSFSKTLEGKAQQFISKILTDLLVQSSQKVEQRSTN